MAKLIELKLSCISIYKNKKKLRKDIVAYMKRIVIVEDDLFMREELENIFLKQNYKPISILSFSNTIEEICQASPDLVLLDLNLPGATGFEICRELKESTSIPILVLTSRDRLKDELHALKLGADEYLTKPCHKDRLLARTENLLKRYEGRKHILDGNGFLFDIQTYSIFKDNTSIVLSENEGKILKTLFIQFNKVVTKEELFYALWGTKEYIDENALQVNMTRLRKTLKMLHLEERIETIRGVGYQLKKD